ncbi:hypothetical protein BDP81DRAFT_406865 [Colletotrichum phormii]|uniref:Uncharacterized protein n=1 Tax=Colletotrichum phormii TaxID=359342 RepID=A0AAI9ZQ37_9PEZI|nr:uncharacterized protein BDP81DRAFT_406865 [Colletotrichum phormii]KAK1636094.1 hypothetical protein BDP81DRAFT_406865 [Colletotrichum phormii]
MFAASRRRVKCDFYVLKDLCTDVVLSNDFLFGYDVFSTQFDSLSEPSYSEEDPELLLISLKRNGRSELMQPENPSNIDYTSANAFSRQRVLAELDRRDKIDERITARGPDEQEAERRVELERRRLWEELRQRHR